MYTSVALWHCLKIYSHLRRRVKAVLAMREDADMKNSKGQNKDESGWKDIHGGCAFIIPLSCIRHESFNHISPKACKLIIDLGRQYSGFNNGYLCVTPSLLMKQGWKSKASIWEAVAECEYYGLIIKTQQGGKNRPSYYAFTWRRINKIPNRPPLDVAATYTSSNDWLQVREPYKPQSRRVKRKNVGTATVSILPRLRANQQK